MNTIQNYQGEEDHEEGPLSILNMNSRFKALEICEKNLKMLDEKIKASSEVAGSALDKENERFPVWPNKVRAIPNSFLRSSLFSVSRTRRTGLEHEKIETVGDLQIFFTGTSLDQFDLYLFENLAHLQRGRSTNEDIRITARSLLKTMGRSDSRSNYRQLAEQLDRLLKCQVLIYSKEYISKGHLLNRVTWDRATGELLISLDSEIGTLFIKNQASYLPASIRFRLRKSPFAQWLGGFYFSHRQPFPYRTSTLLKLSGANVNNERAAEQTLKLALDKLSAACLEEKLKFTYVIRNGLVTVKRDDTKSETRQDNGRVYRRPFIE